MKKRILWLGLSLSLLFWLPIAGCGMQGDLYLPSDYLTRDYLTSDKAENIRQ